MILDNILKDLQNGDAGIIAHVRFDPEGRDKLHKIFNLISPNADWSGLLKRHIYYFYDRERNRFAGTETQLFEVPHFDLNKIEFKSTEKHHESTEQIF